MCHRCWFVVFLDLAVASAATAGGWTMNVCLKWMGFSGGILSGPYSHAEGVALYCRLIYSWLTRYACGRAALPSEEFSGRANSPYIADVLRHLRQITLRVRQNFLQGYFFVLLALGSTSWLGLESSELPAQYVSREKFCLSFVFIFFRCCFRGLRRWNSWRHIHLFPFDSPME